MRVAGFVGANRLEHADFARRVEHAPVQASDAKGLRGSGCPDVVDHEQATTRGECRSQARRTVVDRAEVRNVSVEALEQRDLQRDQITALPYGDPEHTVGEIPANRRVACQRRRQHRLADPALAMHSDCPPRDPQFIVALAQQRLTQPFELVSPDELCRQWRHVMQFACCIDDLWLGDVRKPRSAIERESPPTDSGYKADDAHQE